jgi:hypothetical protein
MVRTTLKSYGFAVADAIAQVMKNRRVEEPIGSSKRYYKVRKREWKHRISDFLGLDEVFG